MLENKGPSDAENVTLTDAVPAEIVNAEFSLNGGGVWEYLERLLYLADFPVGSSVTVQLRGTADPRIYRNSDEYGGGDFIRTGPEPG